MTTSTLQRARELTQAEQEKREAETSEQRRLLAAIAIRDATGTARADDANDLVGLMADLNVSDQEYSELLDGVRHAIDGDAKLIDAKVVLETQASQPNIYARIKEAHFLANQTEMRLRLGLRLPNVEGLRADKTLSLIHI